MSNICWFQLLKYSNLYTGLTMQSSILLLQLLIQSLGHLMVLLCKSL